MYVTENIQKHYSFLKILIKHCDNEVISIKDYYKFQ